MEPQIYGMMKRFEETVGLAMQRLLPGGGRVVVALSGGRDSVALLRVLCCLGYECRAAHFNFHLRGDESVRDELFVRRLCGGLGVKLHFAEADTREYAARHGVSLEMAARSLRYAFFARVCGEEQAPVAVAHHRDDNNETMLLNLVRGTGIRGLCGMEESSVMHIEGCPALRVLRPMLGVERADVEAWLKARGQDYVDDSTNFVADVKRNRLRLEVMPLMREMNPSLGAALQGMARKLRGVYAVYRNAVGEALRGVEVNAFGDETLPRCRAAAFASLPCLLHEWLAPKGFNEAQVNMLASCRAGGRAESEGWIAVAEEDCFVLVNRATLPAGGEAVLPLGGALEVAGQRLGASLAEELPSAAELRDAGCAYLDAAALELPLRVRRVEPGDRFVPFGMRGSKLVNDFLASQKLPAGRRMRQLLVCDAAKVVWVAGLRTDNRVRISPDTQRTVCVRLSNFAAGD